MSVFLCMLLALSATFSLCGFLVLLRVLERLERLEPGAEAAASSHREERPEAAAEEAADAARRRMDEGVANILSFEPAAPEVRLP